MRVPLLDEHGQPLTDREKDQERARKLTAAISADLRSPLSFTDDLDNEVHPRIRVDKFGALWTEGKLLKIYGEKLRLKEKASARDDRNRLQKYVYPYIGSMAVADVEESDIDRLFRKAAEEALKRRKGKPLSQATKRHIYAVVHRLFDLAIKLGKLRKESPINETHLPAKGPRKLYSFLYPHELVALCACEEIPLVRRVYYVLASYTGLRKKSLRAFTWSYFDFEHSALKSLVNKNLHPQLFIVASQEMPGYGSLMVVMRRYWEHCGRPTGDTPVIADLPGKKDGDAFTLRLDLDCAGIRREMLFTKTDQIEPLRFHDLRATFVTWAKRANQTPGWITDRTGHIGPEQMERYDRGATMLRDLQYVPFPDVSNAIPELSV